MRITVGHYMLDEIEDIFGNPEYFEVMSPRTSHSSEPPARVPRPGDLVIVKDHDGDDSVVWFIVSVQLVDNVPTLNLSQFPKCRLWRVTRLEHRL